MRLPRVKCERTWAHVVDTTSPELRAHPLRGSQTKVRDSEAKSIVKAENVLRLQIAVVDAAIVTPLDGIYQLKEHVANALTVSQERPFVKNLSKKIPARCEIHDDVRVL